MPHYLLFVRTVAQGLFVGSPFEIHPSLQMWGIFRALSDVLSLSVWRVFRLVLLDVTERPPNWSYFCLNCQSATCVIYQCLWRFKSSVKEWKPAFCLNDAHSLDPYGAFAVNRLAYFLSVIYHTRRAFMVYHSYWFYSVKGLIFLPLHEVHMCISKRFHVALFLFCKSNFRWM